VTDITEGSHPQAFLSRTHHDFTFGICVQLAIRAAMIQARLLRHYSAQRCLPSHPDISARACRLPAHEQPGGISFTSAEGSSSIIQIMVVL
jgi:hypothetical protein